MTNRASRALRALVPLAAPLAVVSAAYLTGPPPGHTGGFGEPTCRACHFDGPAEDPSVTLRLEGLPEEWTPGTEYGLEVVLVQPGLPAGGFQLSARYAGGGSVGEQAGVLRPGSEGVAIADSAGILYAQHAAGGVRPTSSDTIRWRVAWTAPEEPVAAVAVHLVANAANDDASELGDRIVTLERRSRPCAASREDPCE